MLAAINSSTAKGSNTNINTIMTHLTASSKWSLAPSSPYINSAIYLIGPTSASILSCSNASVDFSNVSSPMTERRLNLETIKFQLFLDVVEIEINLKGLEWVKL